LQPMNFHFLGGERIILGGKNKKKNGPEKKEKNGFERDAFLRTQEAGIANLSRKKEGERKGKSSPEIALGRSGQWCCCPLKKEAGGGAETSRCKANKKKIGPSEEGSD